MGIINCLQRKGLKIVLSIYILTIFFVSKSDMLLARRLINIGMIIGGCILLIDFFISKKKNNN